MPRQVDDAGSKVLVGKIEALGVQVHLNKNTKEILGNGKVEGMVFADGGRARRGDGGRLGRHQAARRAGPGLRARGRPARRRGRRRHLRTSDPDIFAIGEVALHRRHDLRPGRARLRDGRDRWRPTSPAHDRTFTGADLSTKLKLMGVDVASFGDYFADATKTQATRFRGPVPGRLQEAALQPRRHPAARRHPGRRRLRLRHAADALPRAPSPCRSPPASCCSASGEGQAAGAGVLGAMPDDAQVCSCNNVSKAQICQAIRDKDLTTLDEVKTCTKAGTGCGGCVPLVTDLLKARAGGPGQEGRTTTSASTSPYTRQELFQIVKIKRIKTFDELIAEPRPGARLRDLQAGRRLDPGQPVEREHPRAHHAPGHERSLPGQHPARRTVLGRAPRPRRRDHAREADRPRGRSPRSTASTPRSPAASASICSARRCISFPTSGKSWSTPASRAATPTARRCAPSRAASARPGAATACRTPSASPSASRIATAASARRTSSRRPSPAASANAPRPRARTSA